MEGPHEHAALAFPLSPKKGEVNRRRCDQCAAHRQAGPLDQENNGRTHDGEWEEREQFQAGTLQKQPLFDAYLYRALRDAQTHSPHRRPCTEKRESRFLPCSSPRMDNMLLCSHIDGLHGKGEDFLCLFTLSSAHGLYGLPHHRLHKRSTRHTAFPPYTVLSCRFHRGMCSGHRTRV